MKNRLLLTGGVVALVTALAGAASAKDKHRCKDEVCCCTHLAKSGGWKVLESQNFRVHFVGDAEVAESIVPLCENSCHRVRQQWLAAKVQAEWSPKCDVYLYRSGREFEKYAQAPAEVWGFADLAVGDGKVWSRKLHMRVDDLERLKNVLVHELTHVVMAEKFTDRPIPRWADEGIAVCCEPEERRRAFVEPLAEEASKKRLLTLRDLTRMQHVPQDPRQGELFYGESGALIEFLMSEQKLKEPQVLALIDDCDRRGWNNAVSRHLPKTTAKQFETSWNTWLIARNNPASSDTLDPVLLSE
jgi:hypothetical protein